MKRSDRQPPQMTCGQAFLLMRGGFMSDAPIPAEAVSTPQVPATLQRPYETPTVTHLGAWTAITLAVSGPINSALFGGNSKTE